MFAVLCQRRKRTATFISVDTSNRLNECGTVEAFCPHTSRSEYEFSPSPPCPDVALPVLVDLSEDRSRVHRKESRCASALETEFGHDAPLVDRTHVDGKFAFSRHR